MMRRALTLSCLWVVIGCGEQLPGVGGRDSTEVVNIAADVVSRVNGSAIEVEEVQRLAHAGHLPPTTALRRLEAELLLSQEAQRRGYAQSARTNETTRKAQVQELLKAAVEPVRIGSDEIEAAYKAQKARFEQPEKRRATHVLAQLSPDASPADERAAEAFIKQTIRALQNTQDTAATLEAAKEERSHSFSVVVQALPLAADNGAFVPAFSQALFSLSAPGVVPEPVRTQFGYHAIVVTEIVPAVAETRSVAFETLQKELATRRQAKRLDALVDELRGHTPVHFTNDARKIVATLDF